MRVLFIGPPLYGLLYPLISLAQGFRADGHEVVIVSAGEFTQKVANAGLMAFDAAPGLDSEADYRNREEIRKKNKITGNFSFFGDEMADLLVEFAGKWHPDLIVYPPLGLLGPLIAAKYNIPLAMQTVGFGHNSSHIKVVTRTLADAYKRHGITNSVRDVAWLDVTPPSMSRLESGEVPIIPMRYIPYNGGGVWEKWWDRKKDKKRLLISLGTLTPMVDGLELISWVMDSANEVDAEIILQLAPHCRTGLRELPPNVRLVDWIPTGVFLNGADGFIHHGGAGNTLTALHSGIPQIVFGQGADRPVNAKAVFDRGCGLIPNENGLTTKLINDFLENSEFRRVSTQVAAEMATQSSPVEVARLLINNLMN